MTMFVARASVPMWAIAVCLAAGAFLAPAGIARVVLLVAFCLVCIPAAITAGFRKRTLREGAPTAEMMNVWHTASQRGHVSQPAEIIEAEFEAHDEPRADGAHRVAIVPLER